MTQRWQQSRSNTFNTYEEAKAFFDAGGRHPRKRIRKRAGGTYDVVEWEEVPPMPSEGS